MTAAERTERRARFLASIPRAPGVDDYQPLDSAERVDTHQATSGHAASWPIPLTHCT